MKRKKYFGGQKGGKIDTFDPTSELGKKKKPKKIKIPSFKKGFQKPVDLKLQYGLKREMVKAAGNSQ